MLAKQTHLAEKTAHLFHLIGQTSRLEILLAIGAGEACVCHLEAWLGYRQASISQQLMLLRDGGLVTSRRVGKHIFYALKDPALIGIITQLAALDGFHPEDDLAHLAATAPLPGCVCPVCNPEEADLHTESEPNPAIRGWQAKAHP
ncbi:MAG TPA: metalloregulator ArsR/SmtB family transcription factor [Anaerolineaceae bacterium]|jgi:ArsR family transcriptional regulator